TDDVPAVPERTALIAQIDVIRAKQAKLTPTMVAAVDDAKAKCDAAELAFNAARSALAEKHGALAQMNLESEIAIQAAEGKLRETASPKIAETIAALWRRFNDVRMGPLVTGTEFTGRDMEGRAQYRTNPGAITTDAAVASIRSAIKEVE